MRGAGRSRCDRAAEQSSPRKMLAVEGTACAHLRSLRKMFLSSYLPRIRQGRQEHKLLFGTIPWRTDSHMFSQSTGHGNLWDGCHPRRHCSHTGLWQRQPSLELSPFKKGRRCKQTSTDRKSCCLILTHTFKKKEPQKP